MNDKEYRVNKGDVFVSRKGDFTSYIADKQQPFTYIWISFECDREFSELLVQNVFSALWAFPIFSKIPSCKTAAVPEWAVCSKLYEFFSEIVSQQGMAMDYREEYVYRAVDYIKSSYSEPIKIGEVASALGISRNYFCRIFKECIGISPQEYLVSYRMNKAIELLEKQCFTQKEIAMRIGYPDVYTFSRMFKKKYGVPPGEYSKSRSIAL